MTATYIVAFFFALGLFFLALALGRASRRRPLAAMRSGLACCLFVGLGLLSTAAGMNLWTYHRLSFEQPVASLEFRQLGPQRYLARLIRETGEEQDYEISGDQWQLEARVLKWRAPANLLGLDAQYRLERITGRYSDIESERSGLRSAHDLSAERGLDFWRITQRYPQLLPLVDARYGNAAYMPMANMARYQVSLTQSGLVARPDNDAAQQALRRW